MSVVRTRSARVAVAAVAALAVGLGTSACTSSPGAAALVGDDRISVATLQGVVNRALADPQAEQQLGQDRAKFTREQLGRLINNVLVGRIAARDGITVSKADVDQQLAQFAQSAGGEKQLEQQAAASGVPVKDLRTFIRYYVMQQKIADRLIADVTVSDADLQAAYQKNIDQFDQVNSQHILVASKKLADSILAQVKAKPSLFAALAKRYSIDTGSKTKAGNLGFQAASTLVKPFADAIFAAKPGTYLEVHSQFGWHVVHVIAHRTTPLAAVADQLKAQILQPKRQQLVQQALAAEGRKEGVHVSPRYGTWNSANGTVVAPSSKGDLSSPAPSPASS
ncbi:MAG: peptidyl-prolyl cis-trans isomerase [Frankiaceae bacterium]|jgi:parvulin-like peptidyl-prolyl isomerase|nr:peptidyl-prolyl cis-trans isomerase [Frankiaceae bacterium]